MRADLIYKLLFALLVLFTAKIIILDTDFSYPEDLGHIRHINSDEKEINYRFLKILNIRNSIRQYVEEFITTNSWHSNQHTFANSRIIKVAHNIIIRCVIFSIKPRLIA